MAFYNPFPQFNTGLNQAQQWSMGQQAALPPQSPPYGTPPIPTYSGRPFMDALRNMFGNIRQNRQFRQLARQGINPFTGQTGTSIQSQPDTGMGSQPMSTPSRQLMPRTIGTSQQNMGFQPQNMGFNPYQQLGMMYGMGGLGGMLGYGQGAPMMGQPGFQYDQRAIQANPLGFLQQLASSQQLYGNRNSQSNRGSRVPRGAY